ncbi:Hypothetical protein, putative [Bodo saltans]|uniref:Uncharacterized protein n=1 Tax=Bodo saltans TaxID=75058 RepID=A0A0S4JVC8_BODSA|nr:Hypothetical protein, putative [Bodo saltans]|eukprot:CUG92529.1 Hypothetical protein, putative [Bodo saltans]
MIVPVGRRAMGSPPRLGATIPPTSPPRRIDRMEEFVVSSPPPQQPQQLVVSPIRIPTPHDVHVAATAVGSVIEENPHNPGPEPLAVVHNSSSKQILQQEMNSTSAESAVVLVGWSEADASAMIDDVNNSIRVDGDDTGFVVPPQQRQQPQQDPHMPQREEPSRQDQQHHPQHRRASTSPHPVFVVPSRDSSVDSRRSASALRNTQHLMDVDASQQQLRWEEIRLPEGRNPHRASSPMFVPPAVHQQREHCISNRYHLYW